MVIQRRTGWTAQITPRVLAAAVCCLALVAAGCSNDDGLKAGDAASIAEASSAEVSIDDGDWTPYAGGDAISEGARVRATSDEARLVFRSGGARLAPGAVATLTGDALTIERGEVLIDGGLTVVAGDTRVMGDGVVRVSAGLSSRVAVYRGTATVARPAQDRWVAQLRQLDLVPFRLAAEGHPLRYREGDAWDRELLADAIAFDGEAARLARGIDVEFGTAPQAPGFYREFTQRKAIPLLQDAAPVTKGARFGPASDVLLTAFVADAATPAESLREGISAVSGLREAGARWGLIAVELDVRSDAVVAAIDTLDSDQLALADRSSGAAPAGDADDAGGVDTGAGDGPGGVTSSDPGSDDPTPPTGGGDAPPPPDPDDGEGDNDGDGAGDGPGPLPPPPPPEEPEGTVEEVVSEVIDNVSGDDDDSKGGGLPKLPDLPPPLPKLLDRR